MKKKMLLLTLAAAMIVSLTACSGANYNFDLTKYITLGTYKGIEVSAAELATSLQSQIDSLITQNTTENQITDRAVASGDTVNVDYVGKYNGEVYTSDTESTSETGLNIVVGSGDRVNTFDEALLGHKGGDTYSVDISYPDDYEKTEDLRGKTLTFDVTVNYIAEEVIPEFNDAFVVEKTDYATVDEYKTETTKTLRDTYVWNKAVANTTVIKYPEKNVKTYYDNTVSTYKAYASAYGYSFDSFITSYMGQDVATFLSELANYAKTQVKNEMIYNSIAKAEGITVTKDEYNARIDKYIKQYEAENQKALEKQYGKDVIEKSMLYDMVLEFVAGQAVDVD